MRCEEAQELITALVDNELSRQERTSIEGHLRDCPRCQLVHEEEQALKKQLRMVGANLRAPADLRERILADKRIFPETAKTQRRKEIFYRWNSLVRPAFALALLALLVIPAVYLTQLRGKPISIAAVETHEPILKGDLPLTIKTSSPERLRDYLVRSVEGRFAPMGYDLSTMNLKPIGGLVHDVKGRKILAVLYEGKDLSLICYTFLGKEEDAPDNAALFFDPEKNINFYTFSRGGVNGVLHREGKVICILVSKMPMRDLLALARSKAQPS